MDKLLLLLDKATGENTNPYAGVPTAAELRRRARAPGPEAERGGSSNGSGSALLRAVLRRDLDAVQLHLRGPHPALDAHGLTALHAAALADFGPAVPLLVDAGGHRRHTHAAAAAAGGGVHPWAVWHPLQGAPWKPLPRWAQGRPAP